MLFHNNIKLLLILSVMTPVLTPYFLKVWFLMKLFKQKYVQCATHQAFGGWGRVRSSIQDSRVFFFGDFFFLTKKGQHCCANNWLLINFTGHKKKTLSNLPPVQKKRNIKWLEVILYNFAFSTNCFVFLDMHVSHFIPFWNISRISKDRWRQFNSKSILFDTLSAMNCPSMQWRKTIHFIHLGKLN